MLTLTFPKGVQDYDVAYRLVSRWLHYRGGVVRRRGRYVAVPELHPGGHGYHFHVLFPRGRVSGPDLEELRVSWTAHLRAAGYCEADRTARIHVKRWSSARKASRYAAKYVAKAFVTEDGELARALGRHRYFPSVGLQLPESHSVIFSSLGNALASLGDPRFWARFYDARPDERPFLWVSWDPPD